MGIRWSRRRSVMVEGQVQLRSREETCVKGPPLRLFIQPVFTPLFCNLLSLSLFSPGPLTLHLPSAARFEVLRFSPSLHRTKTLTNKVSGRLLLRAPFVRAFGFTVSVWRQSIHLVYRSVCRQEVMWILRSPDMFTLKRLIV